MPSKTTSHPPRPGSGPHIPLQIIPIDPRDLAPTKRLNTALELLVDASGPYPAHQDRVSGAVQAGGRRTIVALVVEQRLFELGLFVGGERQADEGEGAADAAGRVGFVEGGGDKGGEEGAAGGVGHGAGEEEGISETCVRQGIKVGVQDGVGGQRRGDGVVVSQRKAIVGIRWAVAVGDREENVQDLIWEGRDQG